MMRQAKREMGEFLRGKCWQAASRYQFGLALDYVIHLLNHSSKDPLGLYLGESVAKACGEAELERRCHVASRRLSYIRDVSDVSQLVKSGGGGVDALPTPSTTELVEWKRSLELQSSQSSEEESLAVSSHTPLLEINKLCEGSCRRATGGVVLAEVLKPIQSVSGRGMYATKHIPSGSCVLVDEPTVVAAAHGNVCASCLIPIEKAGKGSRTVVCHACEEEAYCSDHCRAKAWESYHSCTCRARNDMYATWQDGMREALKSASSASSRLDPTSNSRAALTCLAVGKVCAIATMQQRHPMSIDGIRFLDGIAHFSRSTAVAEVGRLAVTLSTALRQPYLFMEEVLSLFAVLQTNEFLINGSLALYPTLSFLNHSCVPNCTAVGTTRCPVKRQLITLRDVRAGEELMIDYTGGIAPSSSSLSWEDRKALCQQRGFTCYCAKCIRGE